MRTYGQDGDVAIVEFDYHDFKAGVFVPVMKLPVGAYPVEAALVVTQASNAGTTDTLSVGTAAAPAVNLAATDVKTAGKTAFASLAVASGVTLGITRATTGAAPTAGKGFIFIRYITPGIADYIMGDLNDAEEAVAEANLNVPR